MKVGKTEEIMSLNASGISSLLVDSKRHAMMIWTYFQVSVFCLLGP